MNQVPSILEETRIDDLANKTAPKLEKTHRRYPFNACWVIVQGHEHSLLVGPA